MPLTGELEHLPIVDVIQLINSTRKSGTLFVYSRKGEGQLVFDNGYIVGASHSNEKLRIGQILLEAGIISKEDLDKALAAQKAAGENRKPLISTLLEDCGMSKEAAFKSLETLIEMTVVEMISWTRGIFSFDVDNISVTDDYRYLPEQIQKQATFDSQMVLMDALRIYDEKVYAGEIEVVDEPLDQIPEHLDQHPEEEEEPEELILSDEILGLADLDKIERKKPRAFRSLEAFDPSEIHRQIIKKALPGLPAESHTEIADFLSELSSPSLADEVTLKTASQSQAIVMYAKDELLQHAVMTVCKREGIMVFTTSDEQDLEVLISRALEKQLDPILVFDYPTAAENAFDKETLIATRRHIKEKNPRSAIIQLCSSADYDFSLHSLRDGIRTVFPKPLHSERHDKFTSDMIDFLKSFQAYIQGCFNDERRQQFAKLRNSLSKLKSLHKAPDISLAVLNFVGEIFDRSLTFIVDKNALIAERSIGIRGNKLDGPSAPLKFRVPVREDSVLSSVICQGEAYFGAASDSQIKEALFPEIGAPVDSKILLLPMVCNGRVITLTYADFGDRQACQVPIDYIDFFSGQAGLTMENALFRKKMDKN